MSSWFDSGGGVVSGLAIATRNEGKFVEIAALLSPFVEVVRTLESGDSVEETASDYEGNALLKARTLFARTGLACLADDSGFEVVDLDDRPGLHSARWAQKAGQRDFSYAMRKVEKALAEKGKRQSQARFVCALAIVRADGAARTFRGTVQGRTEFPPRGGRGFGYDPIFVPEGETRTFAEMAPEQKHARSHRSVAFRLLTEACFTP